MVVESLVGPLFAVASRAAGEPIPMYPFTMLAGCLGGCWAGWRYQFTAPWSALGFDSASWHPARLLAGFGVGALAIGATAGLLWATGFVRFDATPLAIDGIMADSWGGTALRLFILLAPSALWEEIAFRGYLQAVAREAGNSPTLARTAQAVAFGAIHLTNPGAGVRTTLIVMLAGWCLALVRERTGLPAAWMAHLAWNWVMAALLHMPVSGLPFATPGYRAVVTGPDWLTGGSWGPEGGLLAALVLGAAALLAHRRTLPSLPPDSPSSSLARS
jgi:membrane protease YdiL (CAAX protease family)